MTHPTSHAAPAGIDLDDLTRYDYVPSESGRMVIGQDDNGAYLLRADVESLLARNAACAAPAADERALFEAHYFGEGDPIQRKGDCYMRAGAQLAWDAWRARAALSQQAATYQPPAPMCQPAGAMYQPAAQAVDARQPIGYITTGDIEYTGEGAEIGDWDIEWDRKVIDTMEEFAVPETTYAVYLEPVRAAHPAPVAAHADDCLLCVKNGGYCWRHKQVAPSAAANAGGLLEVADAERKRIAAKYSQALKDGTCEVGGHVNRQWAHLEGAVMVVQAIKKAFVESVQSPATSVADAKDTALREGDAMGAALDA